MNISVVILSNKEINPIECFERIFTYFLLYLLVVGEAGACAPRAQPLSATADKLPCMLVMGLGAKCHQD